MGICIWPGKRGLIRSGDRIKRRPVVGRNIMSPYFKDSYDDREAAWFCIRSQRRSEHIAAANLQKWHGIPVINPLIRFRRKTSRGAIWVTESMFPSYLFARFNWKRSLDGVRHTFGVSGVEHFGGFWPVVPDATIEHLRSLVGAEGVRLVEPAIAVGEEVEIGSGAFEGFRGIVARVMPARDRVAVLLDFLGRQTTVDVPMDGIVRERVRHYRNAA